MTTVESNHPDFELLVGAEPVVELLATGFAFTEGPVWRGDHLLFSDIPSNRIVRFEMLEEGPSITTFLYPSGNSNGQTLDSAGRLITCEHATRRVTRTEPDGSITVLASRFETRRLSSPNDVVVSSDDTVYFTDPPFGLTNQSRDKQLPFNGVFKVGPDGNDLTLLVDDLERPNGLAFSPDGKTLYIADTMPKIINAYPVNADGTLGAGKLFCETPAAEGEQGPGPDGFKVDIEGNVYTSGPAGLWIFSPDGTLLGRIRTAEIPANVAWGDADWKSLYITSRTGLYRMRVNVPGLPV
ncbi:MAG: SMP-30/gluconolactonase/LRE family protein [Chloroflexi bacterium]|nr:SMP-30/gluconolactonase/LRE family protein [Chloroflexota bacterium]